MSFSICKEHFPTCYSPNDFQNFSVAWELRDWKSKLSGRSQIGQLILCQSQETVMSHLPLSNVTLSVCLYFQGSVLLKVSDTFSLLTFSQNIQFLHGTGGWGEPYSVPGNVSCLVFLSHHLVMLYGQWSVQSWNCQQYIYTFCKLFILE